jgi:hypothetical protein
MYPVLGGTDLLEPDWVILATILEQADSISPYQRSARRAGKGLIGKQLELARHSALVLCKSRADTSQIADG